MAELKTKLNTKDPKEFLDSVEDPVRRSDGVQLLDLFSKWTGEKPEMWGDAIIGYGRLMYKNAKGEENEWMRLAFSPRKQSMTIYIMSGFNGLEDLLTELGPHTTSKGGCLYLKKLEKINIKVLEKIVKQSLKNLEKTGIPGAHTKT